MKYIEKQDDTGKRHAAVDVETTSDGKRRATTWCGKTMTGRTGECIAPLIECTTCRAAMRKDGWDI